MTKVSKKVLWILVALVLLCVVIAVITATANKNEEAETQTTEENGMISVSTWEEYLALSLEEQDTFYLQFSSREDFELWMQQVKPSEMTEPLLKWDEAGKNPNEYTWEEYSLLTAEAKEAFYQWFDSRDAFEEWMKRVSDTEDQENTVSWDKVEKQPSEYTWAEYQALSPEEQEKFYQWFASVEAFESWLEREKPAATEETIPEWNKAGKLPDEYTWEEYQLLSNEEKDAFYNWFEAAWAFENWKLRAEAIANEDVKPVPQWNRPGKLPKDYTWEEYQQLSNEEKDAFFNWFGSVWAFEIWMEQVNPTETTAPSQEWNKAGKLPNAYTWEEYQQLTPEEQDAFFRWFGSVELFEAWMAAAMGA